MLSRYCPQSSEEMEAVNKGKNMNSQSLKKQEREIKEARRQIALLFGLLEKDQPVEQLTKLLAAIDNASIEYIAIQDGGEGYAPGYGSPYVVFPEPEAGEGFTTAQGRAKLGPTGRLLRIDVLNRGSGYKRPPSVTVSPPSSGEGRAATAQAYLFGDGINSGRIERISITNSGKGYAYNETISIKIADPDTKQGGVQATAEAIRELKVTSIEIIDGGSGYATEKSLSVFVEPPPLTARVNMNDPMYASSYPSNIALPQMTASSSKPVKQGKSDKNTIDSNAFIAARNGGKGGGGNCVGRACYDKSVKATAFARAEFDTYQSFWNIDDFDKIVDVEKAISQRAAKSKSISGSTTGYDFSTKRNIDLFGKTTSSSELLNLLPSGYGLEFNAETKTYNWALARNFEEMSSDWISVKA